MPNIAKSSPRQTGLWRTSLVVSPVAGILLLASACSATSHAADPPRADSPSVTGGRTPNDAGSSSQGGGRTSSQGGGTASGGVGNGKGGSVGTFTLAFAKCMRSHGIRNFPDPNGRAGQLGPSSGVDPGSAKFRAALNGPCKSLAPLAWVDSGKGSVRGGGS
jgi:hypothetical protein